ncbi:MAG: tetratricopeptide repeat protein [Gemmatimonadaceae bacterium]
MDDVAFPDVGSGIFRDAFQRIEESLGMPDAQAQREALKAEIITLFRAVDKEIGELSTLKDEIKGLVDRWKTLAGEDPTQEPAVAPPTRADHLNASTFVEKGWSLISLGDYEGAEAALEKALQLVPGDTHAEALLGWAQMLQNHFDEALLHFQRVLLRDPANALARVNVGYICLKKGIFGEAIEHLSRVIRADSDRKAVLYAHYYLGLLYFEREMYDDAENFFRKAIGLGPNFVEAHYHLGRALWFAGNREGAVQAWRDGLQANKFNPWGKRCAEILAVVEGGGSPSRSA